jgi:hypothetical protein
MTQLRLIRNFLRGENIRNDIYFDKWEHGIDDESIDLRERFNIYRYDEEGEIEEHDKMVDAVGHYAECPHCVVEVTKTNIQKALSQIRSTIKHIYLEGEEVRKATILIDENSWELPNNYYKIVDDLLYKRRKNNNYKLRVRITENDKEDFDIYCYTVDFEEYGIEED